ncbi:hotdog fold domain-containing protein [Henriciella sp.]|uniref:hotdog fold domain-containing protein n=1 Tax=Henriciella sp. TaxID=1968823 RepID=UPI002620684C|nr:hotdog fold domain-containing protein [Henriciella sp.]
MNEIGTFEIAHRFRGPPQSGNGGYTAGMIARQMDGPARVKLRKPPPLDAPLRLMRDGDTVNAYAGETFVASAEPASVSIELPQVPDAAGLEAARETFLEEAASHSIPGCFVCGPKRTPEDALCLFTGPVPGSPVNADVWVPAEDYAGDDGLVRPEFVWAALDCPTAFALRHGDTKLCLLGSLAVEVHRRPTPGERLIAMAWKQGVDGRKNYADGALVDAAGEVVAASNAVWVELTDPDMIAAIRAGA